MVSVTDAFEGNFKITNLGWDDLLYDPNSEMYQDLSTRLESGLMNKLTPENLDDKAEFFLGNFKFEPGSVKVTFRYMRHCTRQHSENSTFFLQT